MNTFRDAYRGVLQPFLVWFRKRKEGSLLASRNWRHNTAKVSGSNTFRNDRKITLVARFGAGVGMVEEGAVPV